MSRSLPCTIKKVSPSEDDEPPRLLPLRATGHVDQGPVARNRELSRAVDRKPFDPLEYGTRRSRHFEPLGIEGGGHQGAAAHIHDVARHVARKAAAFDQQATLIVHERLNVNLGFVETGEHVFITDGEENGLPARQDLRPAMRPFGSRLLELGHGFRFAALR